MLGQRQPRTPPTRFPHLRPAPSSCQKAPPEEAAAMGCPAVSRLPALITLFQQIEDFFFFGRLVAHGVPRARDRTDLQLRPKPQPWQRWSLDSLCQARDQTCPQRSQDAADPTAPQWELRGGILF